MLPNDADSFSQLFLCEAIALPTEPENIITPTTPPTESTTPPTEPATTPTEPETSRTTETNLFLDRKQIPNVTSRERYKYRSRLSSIKKQYSFADYVQFEYGISVAIIRDGVYTEFTDHSVHEETSRKMCYIF